MNKKLTVFFVAAALIAAPLGAQARDTTRVYALRTGVLPQGGAVSIVATPGSVDTDDIEADLKTTLKERGYAIAEDPALASLIVSYRSSKATLTKADPVFGIERPAVEPGDTHYRLAVSISQRQAPAVWLGYADDYTPDASDDALSFDILWDELEPFFGMSTPDPKESF